MRVIRSSSRESAERALLEEFRGAVARRPLGVVGFATGGTYTALFAQIAQAVRDGELDLAELRATHLDEYSGFHANDRGGMLHELVTSCPPLAEMLAAGRFFPVPSDGSAESRAAHERLLAELGGIDLQFLGIGRNGHIAFNEPGTPFDLGFHCVELTATTRADARSRFAPEEPPTKAVTSGPRTILGARRLVLAAFGSAKAEAVRAMLEGPVDPQCPASCLQRHADCVVYLDRDAAGLLGGETMVEVAS